MYIKGVARVHFLPRHWLNFSMSVACMIIRIKEVKIVACYARAETFTEAVASVASMVATPLYNTLFASQLCMLLYKL